MPYEYVALQKVNRSGGNESYIEKISEEKDKLAQEIKQHTDTLQQISS